MFELDPRINRLLEFDGFDWISSDLHLGHKNQAKRRGFEDCKGVGMPDVHDERIIEIWNDLVRPHDLVIVLGDTYLGRVAQALENVKRLHGMKHLILGNHDEPHPFNKQKKIDVHFGPFETLSLGGVVQVAGHRTLLSHFPAHEDMRHAEQHGGVDRYEEFRPVLRGEFLIHGHTHDEDQRLHDGVELHVGLDAWNLAPVSFATVEGIFKGV